MSPLDPERLASCWDGLYRAGKYAEEPPLPFVSTILATLRQHPQVSGGAGLYVGCGNGRNYVPLARAGLDLYGLDVSEVALRELRRRLPLGSAKLICADFQSFAPAARFAYLVAIQVFQHGTQQDVEAHFKRVAEIVGSGGLFFLRANSTRAEIFFRHRRIDQNDAGGFSVECLEGPKSGLPVHFFTRAELLQLAGGAFRLAAEPHETFEIRPPPRRGSWAQWEAIFQRS